VRSKRGRHPIAARHALTAVEVLLGIVVIGVGLVPVLGASISTGWQTGFTRAHAMAHVRATSLMERVAARGFLELARATAAGEALDGPAGAGPGLVSPAQPFTVLAEHVRFSLEGGSMGALTVDVLWQMPGETASRRTRAFRLVTRADSSWTISLPLPRQPDPAPAD
jgi:hypothetical protein